MESRPFALPRGIATLLLATLALGLALPFQPALASTLSWKTAVSGSAATSTNWTPTKVPTASDALVYNLAGSYNVTYGAGVPSILSQTHKLGTVHLDVTPTLAVAQDFRVADASTDNAVATLLAGTMTVAGSTTVGLNGGSIGTLFVTTGATLNDTAATNHVIVGFAGAGTLDVLSGGIVESKDGIFVSNNVAGSGTVFVSGFGGSPVRSSGLFSNGSGADIVIGKVNSGTATIAGGASMSSQRAILVAPADPAVGTLNIEGTGNGHATNVFAIGNLDIARNDLAAAGGMGTVVITDSALVQVGMTRVGDPQGGTGTLRVRKGVQFNPRGLVFDPAHGVLDFNGGTIDVKADPFVPPGPGLDLDSADPELLELENSTTCALSNPSPLGYSLVVGDTHGATLSLSSSSQMTTTSQVGLGLAPGAVGAILVQKSAQLTGVGESDLSVGLGGTGTLSAFSGAHVAQTAVNVAYGGGSVGTVHVSGAGTSLTADSIFVGGHSGAAGGTGKLLVDLNGLVSTTGNTPSLVAFVGDSVVVNSGGTVDVAGQCKLDGALALSGGTVNADSVAFAATTRVSGNGTLGGLLRSPQGSRVTATGGPLTLGSNAAVDGFIDSGRIDVGAQTVTILDGGEAVTDTVTLATGTLNLPAPGAIVANGGLCSGVGHVNGNLSCFGFLQPGASPGLVFSGALTTASGLVAGGTLNLVSGGSLGCVGNVNVTQLIVAAGASLTTNGDATLGSTAAGSTVTLNGALHVRGGTTATVNHVSASPLALGSSTSLAPASTLKRTNGFTLLSGDSLVGKGTINGSFSSSGIVSPGASPGQPDAGQLSFTGTFAQSAGGKLVLSIGSTSATAFDQVFVTGAATLAGTLDVRLLPGTVPQPGQDFTLMTYASHTGSFGTVTILGQPVGTQFTLTYTSTSVVLHVNAITVDVPADPAAGIAAVALVGRSGTRGATCFDLALPRAAHVELAVFGAGGRRVAELFRGDLPAGRSRYMLRAGGRELAPGLYFARAVVTEAAAKAGAGANDDARATVRTARAVVER
jgi:hypothetical protein